MKRLLSVLLCLLMLVTCALAEENAALITLDLTTATDEELAEAAALIAAEQRARIKTTITLDNTSATLNKGKQMKLTATVAGLPEGAQQPKLVWSTSDKAVATVQNGSVNAVGAGEAVISCAITVDGMELTAECFVTVIIPVSSVTLEKRSVSLGVGETFAPEFKIQPKTATTQTLAYSSSDEAVATVDEHGVITAVGPGKCVVTAVSTDGTEKSITANVRVTPFEAEETTFTITEKKGGSFSIKYYGKTLKDLKFNISGSTYADVKKSLNKVEGQVARDLTFEVTPLKTGTVTITITDVNDEQNKIVLKVVIDKQAVYSQESYPKIKYENAFRYPDKYEGKQVSFSGQVLQVMDGSSNIQYRISSKGRYDDVVYVVLSKADQTIPLLEDDKVTVYGVYAGTYSYKSVRGDTITIPLVYAERINLQKK